ncbi:AAA family ATPase [Pseudomonas sp. Irchel 3A5]|uniref:AAA family ATPase n=1 Tax=Pseudomonas sp. Irchel 3A5 TaxID=2008911 RepID=UPI000BA40EC7|nr:ATP-binding protein [Pseudomonas sp. Irchel 3A5]
MARGELMKKLLASYGREDDFRAVAEQIILEEEQKNNRVLARSLRKTLDHATATSGNTSKPAQPKSLGALITFPDAGSDFVERVEPTHTKSDITLSHANIRVFTGLIQEFRRSDEIRRNGLPVRSKLLFCGPPGCGKTLCAEVFAVELGLPLFVVKLDQLISSYLGETAGNVRKIFEFARKQPCVLFLDEFDALARSRDDSAEHNELRRVVNSLLLFIDRMQTRGFMIAATNLDSSLDAAIWRRFDEVVWFDRPDLSLIAKFVSSKFCNSPVDFEATKHIHLLEGYSYAEIERVCIQAIKSPIIKRRKKITEQDFIAAIGDETRRRTGRARL